MNKPSPKPDPHPNELDMHRITRLLEQRHRYRYVTPEVRRVEGGYWVVSPCCSRNIDTHGGLIDIARLVYEATSGKWQLYRRDHQGQSWELYRRMADLHAAIALINADPNRVFWQ